MHAKDLIYMAYFDPHQVFDGLTSYIHSMRRRCRGIYGRDSTHLLCYSDGHFCFDKALCM